MYRNKIPEQNNPEKLTSILAQSVLTFDYICDVRRLATRVSITWTPTPCYYQYYQLPPTPEYRWTSTSTSTSVGATYPCKWNSGRPRQRHKTNVPDTESSYLFRSRRRSKRGLVIMPTSSHTIHCNSLAPDGSLSNRAGPIHGWRHIAVS